MQFASFLGLRLRASPFFQLLEWEQLSADQKTGLSNLYDSADVYGVFQPLPTALQQNPLVAYREAAFLFLHLTNSLRLPRCLLSGDQEELEALIANLVMNDVIAIENGDAFVSGREAIPILYKEEISNHNIPPNCLSLLSLDAISFAYRLHGLSKIEMVERLYRFHTAPFQITEKASTNVLQETQDFLFAGAPEAVLEQLADHWELTPPFPGYDWLSWHRKNCFAFTEGQPVYKLYLSPVAAQLPVVFQRAIPAFTESEAYGFKVGAGAGGWARPDKLIIYFENKEALLAAAAMLASKLDGFSVHGVPFTSQLDGKGLISWGIDPPSQDGHEAADGGSWRTMIAGHLATAILEAQAKAMSWPEALPFLRAKLFLAGIDPDNWQPVETVTAEVFENSGAHD